MTEEDAFLLALVWASGYATGHIIGWMTDLLMIGV